MRSYLRSSTGVAVMGLLLLVALLAFSPFPGLAGSSIDLLTAEEAARPDARESGLIDIAYEPDTGPGLNLFSPAQDGNPQKPPLDIDLKFVPKPGTTVDLSKLKVQVVKFVNIDITDRVKPFANANGIFVKDAGFPSGEHKVRVTVGDSDGGRSVKVFFVKVI